MGVKATGPLLPEGVGAGRPGGLAREAAAAAAIGSNWAPPDQSVGAEGACAEDQPHGVGSCWTARHRRAVVVREAHGGWGCHRGSHSGCRAFCNPSNSVRKSPQSARGTTGRTFVAGGYLGPQSVGAQTPNLREAISVCLPPRRRARLRANFTLSWPYTGVS